MASFRKRSGGWRAEVAIKGIRTSETFSTKAEAVAWAAQVESDIRKGAKVGIVPNKTVEDAFNRYLEEVSSSKPGNKWEITRLRTIQKFRVGKVALSEMKLSDLTPETFGGWRDYRLNKDKVTGSTVNREIKLLSHVFTVCSTEWRWMAENPLKSVRRPRENSPRDVLYDDDQILRITSALGFNEERVSTLSGCLAVSFLFAIETGMRQGEILKLTKDDISGRVATLSKTKNGDSRFVPLSKRALELLTFLPEPEEGGTLFHVSSHSAGTLFRRAKIRCGLKDYTFHDTRHLAVTRLAKKFDVLELARVVGHRNINQLRTYYNAKAEDLANKLD